MRKGASLMSRRTLRSLIPALAIVCVCSEALRVAGADEKQTRGFVTCQELKRQGEWPEFTNSGVWSADGTRLFLLDNARQRLLEFSTEKSERVVQGEIGKRLKRGIPRRVVPLEGGGIYVQTDENRFTEIRGKSIKDVVASPSPSHGIISKVYNFTVVGEEVVAFVDVEESSDTWQRGFVVFPRMQPEAFRWLRKGISTAERTFYRLSFPYIATIGDTAYVLRMETRPELYAYTKEFGDSLEPVDAFNSYTAETHLLPELPQTRQPADFEQVMRVVERSQMPVGLYGWKGKLFLLERTWTGKNTAWGFVVIDPKKSEAKLRRIDINVSAEHLFAVPGMRQWTLVLKAHPTGLLSQRVMGIRFFASKAFQGSVLPPGLCSN